MDHVVHISRGNLVQSITIYCFIVFNRKGEFGKNKTKIFVDFNSEIFVANFKHRLLTCFTMMC